MSEQKTKAIFKVVDGPDFPTTREVAEMTTIEIAKHVNSSFRRMFSDYHGCTVQCDITQYPRGAEMLSLDANHPVQVTLYFLPSTQKASSDGKFVAFRPVEATEGFTGKSLVAPILNHNRQMRQNRSSVATQDAIDIFHNLLWPEVYARTTENPSMKEMVDRGVFTETTMNTSPVHGYMQPGRTVYSVVNFIDINKIWKALWKDIEKGDEFRTRPIKPQLSLGEYMRQAAIDQQRAVPVSIPGFAEPVYLTKTEMPYIVEVSKHKGKAIADLYESMNGTGTDGIFTESY